MITGDGKPRANSPELELVDNGGETSNQSARASHATTARKSASHRALHLAVYDHSTPTTAAPATARPGSDIDQSQYRTWAQAWISRLSHASLDDRIGPTKFLPSSPPRHHSRISRSSGSSTPRSAAAAERDLDLSHGQQDHSHAQVRYQKITPGVLHLGRSHGAATPHTVSVDILSGISLDSNLVRRTNSLRLVDRRMLLSKYASFNYTPRGPMANQQRNTMTTPYSHQSLALTVVKSRAASGFQQHNSWDEGGGEGGTEEDKSQRNDYQGHQGHWKYTGNGSQSARYDRDLVRPAFPMTTARDAAPYQHKRRVTNAFMSVPLTTGRRDNSAATCRSRNANNRVQSRAGSATPAFDNIVTNCAIPRLNLSQCVDIDSDSYS